MNSVNSIFGVVMKDSENEIAGFINLCAAVFAMLHTFLVTLSPIQHDRARRGKEQLK